QDGALLLDRAHSTSGLDGSGPRDVPSSCTAALTAADAHRLLRAVLGLPRPVLHPALPRSGADLAGHASVRPERTCPPPLLVLLGSALLLEQPVLAAAGRRTPEPPMAGWRGARVEPRLACGHPGALRIVEALQVGLEGQQLRDPVHRL